MVTTALTLNHINHPQGRANVIPDDHQLSVSGLGLLGLHKPRLVGGRGPSRHCAGIEDQATDFAELPRGGSEQKAECSRLWCQFSYSGYPYAAVLRQMATLGGPIREGLYIRISYSGSDILRLEIAK